MKKETFRLLAALAGLGAVAGVFSPGCGSQAASVCSTICDCEHCNDDRKKLDCDTLAGREAVAKDYGCGNQFSDLLTCMENNGKCDDQQATFSTRPLGSCSGVQDLMTACTVNADCPNRAYCATTCKQRICAGGGNQVCMQDSDCPSGPDACQAQTTALTACESAASASKQVAGQ